MSSLAYLLDSAFARQRNGESPAHASFNALSAFDADLAIDIIGTDDDPHHDLRAFWLRMADELGEE